MDSDFHDKDGRNRHVQSVHKGIRYPCKQCGEVFSLRGLRMHVKSVHEGVKYTCNQCDHQASQSKGLKDHKRYVHDGVKVQCKQCDKQFSEASIKIHVKTVHEGAFK